MLLLFESVHRVMEAEAALIAENVRHELLPTPKEISAECGMCIGVNSDDLDKAKRALSGLKVELLDWKGDAGP